MGRNQEVQADGTTVPNLVNSTFRQKPLAGAPPFVTRLTSRTVIPLQGTLRLQSKSMATGVALVPLTFW